MDSLPCLRHRHFNGQRLTNSPKGTPMKRTTATDESPWPAMSECVSAPTRELAQRLSGTVEVLLLWHRKTDRWSLPSATCQPARAFTLRSRQPMRSTRSTTPTPTRPGARTLTARSPSRDDDLRWLTSGVLQERFELVPKRRPVQAGRPTAQRGLAPEDSCRFEPPNLGNAVRDAVGEMCPNPALATKKACKCWPFNARK
jgi:hypothetical protein